EGRPRRAAPKGRAKRVIQRLCCGVASKGAGFRISLRDFGMTSKALVHSIFGRPYSALPLPRIVPMSRVAAFLVALISGVAAVSAAETPTYTHELEQWRAT